MPERIVITGTGAISAAGTSPASIWEEFRGGRSAIRPISRWDVSHWPRVLAGEVGDFDPALLVPDRKLHKLIRRTDFFGLFAADQALASAGFVTWRDGLSAAEREACNERTGVLVGSGGGAYENQYDFFPLLTRAAGSLAVFGRELERTVNPMFLLRSLPNNVLCHLGIRHGFKGPNACITNHSVSGALAIVEAAAMLRAGEADRALAVAHDAPIEPESILHFDRLGLLARDTVRPFDARRDGSLLGEGGAALMLETAAAARERGATILGEVLGGGCVTEGEGVLPVRPDGGGLVRAMRAALEDAGLCAADVGMIVAHGNGTRQSDSSEAIAIRAVFGAGIPPVTASKWAMGHLLAASSALDAVLALEALRNRAVPGIATLREPAPECAGLPVSTAVQSPRSNVALILSRGFGGMNAALLVRGASA
jgi:3-oxoacyl-[acyl-carrier-protein] synthase-1